MDPKVIEMNNLRVLGDYLNQTLDVLVRGQRGHAPGVGYSPFTPAGYSPFAQTGYSPFAQTGYSPFAAPIPGAVGGLGTDVVYGPSPYAYSPFAATNPFTGLPLTGAPYGNFAAWQQAPWTAAPQTPWTAGTMPWTAGQGSFDAARQTQLTHALAAKQSVLEAMCRMVGLPI